MKDDKDELRIFIEEVLNTDPEAAGYFYEAVKGKLALANSDTTDEIKSGTKLTLLRLNELQALGIVEKNGIIITSAPSSSSSSSSSSGTPYTSGTSKKCLKH